MTLRFPCLLVCLFHAGSAVRRGLALDATPATATHVVGNVTDFIPVVEQILTVIGLVQEYIGDRWFMVAQFDPETRTMGKRSTKHYSDHHYAMFNSSGGGRYFKFTGTGEFLSNLYTKDPVQYGGGFIVKGNRDLKMQMGTGYTLSVQSGGGSNLMLHNQICEFDLSAGRIVVLTGQTEGKSCKYLDNTGWSAPSTPELALATYVAWRGQICSDDPEPDVCMQKFVCAIDSLEWVEEYPGSTGAVEVVNATTSCPYAGQPTRPGLVRQGKDCSSFCSNRDAGPCDFCGADGLCCREPGLFDSKYSADGCGNKGCSWRHCCVAK